MGYQHYTLNYLLKWEMYYTAKSFIGIQNRFIKLEEKKLDSISIFNTRGGKEIGVNFFL